MTDWNNEEYFLNIKKKKIQVPFWRGYYLPCKLLYLLSLYSESFVIHVSSPLKLTPWKLVQAFSSCKGLTHPSMCLQSVIQAEEERTTLEKMLLLLLRRFRRVLFRSIGEGKGNPLQCSCLENPRDGGAWWAAVYGVAQSQTRLKRLSSSSSQKVDFSISQRILVIQNIFLTQQN